jgi:hypothetical protein
VTGSDARITCQEVTELVNDYVEGALAPHAMALFEQHLNFCGGCDWYVEQIRTTIRATGRLSEADVPAPIRDGLLLAFRARRGT